MDAYEILKRLFFLAEKIFENDTIASFDSVHTKKLVKVLEVLTPILIIVSIYHCIKYNMISKAQQYENYIKRKRGYLKKISKKLKHLSRLNGQVYFCYMPVSHGTRLPPTYTLFMAIKEVLISSDTPAARGLRTNLLSDLIRSDSFGYVGKANRMEYDFLDPAHNEEDPFSDLNVDMMKYSREMIVHGIKDFDVMYSLYQLMETVLDDSDD